MTVRNKGLAGQQTLVWDAENRLSQVQDNNGNLVERYWYDVDGARVKKTSGTTTTYTFFAHYEEEVTGVVTTTVSHYSFGGLRIAVKRGSDLYHLHGDHLGSASLTTSGSAETASRAYYAYGAERSATGDLQTDHTFTGQKRDAAGLMYYNARYYDPALGTFVSPDSMVPNSASVIAYNRFLYARGNPLKYTDPSGHDPLGPDWVEDFKAAHGGVTLKPIDRFYRIVSLSFTGGGPNDSWEEADWIRNWKNPVLTPAGARELAGIKSYGSWDTAELVEITVGVLRFGAKLGTLIGGSTREGLAHLKTLLGGGVTWFRGSTDTGICSESEFAGTLACVVTEGVYFFDELFTHQPTDVQGGAIHELAHVIENT